ncbi:MAG: hypothetical protein AAF525_11095 [Pseudomonadota bacterium]
MAELSEVMQFVDMGHDGVDVCYHIPPVADITSQQVNVDTIQEYCPDKGDKLMIVPLKKNNDWVGRLQFVNKPSGATVDLDMYDPVSKRLYGQNIPIGVGDWRINEINVFKTRSGGNYKILHWLNDAGDQYMTSYCWPCCDFVPLHRQPSPSDFDRNGTTTLHVPNGEMLKPGFGDAFVDHGEACSFVGSGSETGRLKLGSVLGDGVRLQWDKNLGRFSTQGPIQMGDLNIEQIRLDLTENDKSFLAILDWSKGGETYTTAVHWT